MDSNSEDNPSERDGDNDNSQNNNEAIAGPSVESSSAGNPEIDQSNENTSAIVETIQGVPGNTIDVDTSSSVESGSSNSSNSSSASSSSFSSYNSLLARLRRERVLAQAESATTEVLTKPKPKHKFIITTEIVNREFGFSNRKHGHKKFEERLYGSLHAVQRQELMYRLKAHSGCVNALNFNQSGSLLASGSDDLSVCVWDWASGTLIHKFCTGHSSNVFQCKFLPLGGHVHIATCGRDGQVRLLELDSSGGLRSIRRVGSHARPSHKISLVPGSPHCFLSCGEDALVLSVDIRQPRSVKMMRARNEKIPIPLYSISCHPIDDHEFMVGGRDSHLRIFDRRHLREPVIILSPSHFSKRKKSTLAYISSAVYNFNGSEVLASYNDDDIYLWDRIGCSTGADFVHKYEGHRNSATLKGVNFFGPRSEFIVSGSDCGNIFFWERETEAIVQLMQGDDNGAINVLEPHPSIPVIATSGLDDDVKVWVPSCEKDPSLQSLKLITITNRKDREAEQLEQLNPDSEILWTVWRSIRASARYRAAAAEARANASEEENSTSDSILNEFADDDFPGFFGEFM